MYLLVYTSGTTGQPKGVQHTHTTLLAELRTRLTGVADDSVILAAFPSDHVAGTLGLLRMLLQGMPHVVMDTRGAATAARLINEHGVTATGGTPFFLTTLLDLAGEVDLSCLREYGVGGASVPPSGIERERLEIVDDLPRTATGKVRKDELRNDSAPRNGFEFGELLDSVMAPFPAHPALLEPAEDTGDTNTIGLYG